MLEAVKTLIQYGDDPKLGGLISNFHLKLPQL